VSFLEAWNKAANIDGWLSQREGGLLYNAAMSLEKGATIVEIGSYKGKSLTLLAETGRNVISVDPLDPAFATGGKRIDAEHVEELSEVVARYDHVSWIRKPACEAQVPARIDMLYIDGDHEPPAPLNDFRHFAVALRHGSLVAFHDRQETGPKLAIGLLEAQGEITFRRAIEGMYLGVVS